MSKASLFLLLVPLVIPSITRAQEASESEAAAVEAVAVEAASAPEAPAAPSVPPVMVVVLSSGRVPPELGDSVRAHLVESIAPMAGGRPVLPLVQPEMVAALTACGADEACMGGIVASANAIGAVVATLSRRTARGPVALTLDLRDPVSGSPRLATQSLALEAEGDLRAALAPLTEALRPVMFSPPPPPPELLVTVNVDGATVLVDGERIGVSPLAAVRLTPGRHLLLVTAPEYAGASRNVELEAGDRERIDITLVPSLAVPMDEVIAADGTIVASTPWYEEWWVWTIVGGVVVVGVGVGVGVGVAAGSGPPPDPMGIGLPPIR